MMVLIMLAWVGNVLAIDNSGDDHYDEFVCSNTMPAPAEEEKLNMTEPGMNHTPVIRLLHLMSLICFVGIFVIIIQHIENGIKVKVDDDEDSLESLRGEQQGNHLRYGQFSRSTN